MTQFLHAEAVPTHDDRFLTAIARRNTAWARWQDAMVLMGVARDEIGFDDLRPYIQEVNEAQHEFEHAARDLVRARVQWRASASATQAVA